MSAVVTAFSRSIISSNYTTVFTTLSISVNATDAAAKHPPFVTTFKATFYTAFNATYSEAF